jgi:transcriptional regulator with XRE-family HTH domain
LRQRRILLGVSQTSFGKAAGISFQQVQKYERGDNRTSSSRLFEFAKILDVPVSHFFEGMAPGAATGGQRKAAYINVSRETIELVRAYYKIRNERVRQNILVMVQALAKKG